MWWTKISNWVTVGLGATLLAASVGWYTTNVRLNYTKSELVMEKLYRKNDKLAYEKAQKDAQVKSLNKVIEVERKNAEDARKADEAYTTLLNKYHTSIVRYQASQRSTGRVDLSNTSITSSGSDVTSESTRISITIDDAGICAENTARLQAVKQWAESLKK